MDGDPKTVRPASWEEQDDGTWSLTDAYRFELCDCGVLVEFPDLRVVVAERAR